MKKTLTKIFSAALALAFGSVTVFGSTAFSAPASAQEESNGFQETINWLYSHSETASAEDIETAAEAMENDYTVLQQAELTEEETADLESLLDQYAQNRSEKVTGNAVQDKSNAELMDYFADALAADQGSVDQVNAHVDVQQITELSEDTYQVDLYEWVFLTYEMNQTTDICGYGFQHQLTVSLTDKEAVITEDDWKTEESSGDAALQEEEEPGLQTMVNESYTYTPSKAAAYADQYALQYNTAYYTYTNADAANFVSQCLYAGGLPMTSDWQAKANSSGLLVSTNSSWSYTSSLYDYLVNNHYGTAVENPDTSMVLSGYPVFYYNATTARYSHTAMCVGKNEAGVPIVDAHSNDRYHVPWEMGSTWGKRAVVQIVSTKETTPAETDPEPETTTTGDPYKVITTTSLKIRDAAGTDGKILAAMPTGTIFYVAETVQVNGTLWGKTTYKGVTGWCAVYQAQKMVSSITMNSDAVTLIGVGTTATLQAEILPSDAGNKAVTWSSYNASIAKVDTNGVVTAVAPGVTTIVATTKDGTNKKAICTVTVKEASEKDAQHSYTAEFTWDSQHNCSVTLTCTTEADHILKADCAVVQVVQQKATCVSTGTTRYIASYTAPNEVVYSDYIDVTTAVNPENHEKLTYINYQAPTCESDGYTGLVYCESCHSVVSYGGKVEKLEHTPVKVTGYAPTATTTGLTDGEICSVCGEVLVKQEIIPIPTAVDGIVYGLSTDKNGNMVASVVSLLDGVTMTEVRIPKTITYNGITYKVTSIASKAFKKNTKITRVIIGSNVTKIGSYAFYGCTALSKITMGTNVVSMGTRAFARCTSLSKITLKSELTTIGKYCFDKCSNLKKITIQTKKLVKSKTGLHSFRDLAANVLVYVPKGYLKSYQKILAARNLPAKAVIKEK